ncbi:hypothetical protein [Nevskia soli]|uniref:hypothetical protein n=1 Tax=Nevskia soli TaxID=418856 RepID=UPI0015D6D181|nr:hypothetical protein [Nevskia soli]
MHRVAVLRFEDLSAGGANAWVGRALSDEIAGQLEGTRHHAVIPLAAIRRFEDAQGVRPASAPGISAERSAAIAGGANRIVTGYYWVDPNVAGDRLALTAIEENTETRKERVLFSGSGSLDDLLHFGDEIAHAEDEEARPPITGSARALRAYALGVESSPEQAAPSFEEAVRLDPDFGPPYVALAGIALSRHDRAAFEAIEQAVRARGSGVTPVDRALLNLEESRLNGDAATTVDALGALVKLLPADPFRLRELADAELASNRYAEAADHYRKLAALLPATPEPLNLLGYALMYAGDEPAATKAFADYRRAARNSANAIDSGGDAQFFFRHFGDAEKSYLAAYAKEPNLSDGGDLLKTAWCRLMMNDRAGALQFVNRFLAERARAGDGLAPLHAAPILRVVGQKQQAERMLAAYGGADGVPTAIRNGAAMQLEWWRFLDGTGPAPHAPDALVEAVAAVRHNDFRAATPLWHALVEKTGPTDWWIRTVYARCLRESGQTQEAARYSQYAPVPIPNRTVSLDELWWPWIVSGN